MGNNLFNNKKIKKRELLLHLLRNSADLQSEERILLITRQETQALAWELEKIIKLQNNKISLHIVECAADYLTTETLQAARLFGKIISLVRSSVIVQQLKLLSVKGNVRILFFPVLDYDIFSEEVFLYNFKNGYRLVDYFASVLTAGREIRLWTGRNARFAADIANIKAFSCPGFISEQFSFALPPAVTVSIFPRQSSGSLNAAELLHDDLCVSLDSHVICYVQQGQIIDACAVKPDCDEGLQIISQAGRDGYCLKEIGIGLNPYISCLKKCWLDKSMWGGIYLRFAAKNMINGQNRAGNSLELILTEASLSVDGNLYIFEGKIIE